MAQQEQRSIDPPDFRVVLCWRTKNQEEQQCLCSAASHLRRCRSLLLVVGGLDTGVGRNMYRTPEAASMLTLPSLLVGSRILSALSVSVPVFWVWTLACRVRGGELGSRRKDMKNRAREGGHTRREGGSFEQAQLEPAALCRGTCNHGVVAWRARVSSPAPGRVGVAEVSVVFFFVEP